MKNNPSPEGSGKPWNSEDLVFDRISCSQLAKVCTSYVGMLRLARADADREGLIAVMKLLISIFTHQIALAESRDLPEDVRGRIASNAQTALLASAMMSAAICNSIDPRHLSQLSISVVESLHALTEIQGPIGDDDVVIVDIRKADELNPDDDEALQMGIRLEPLAKVEQEIDSTELGRKISNIVRNSGHPTMGGVN